MKTQKLYPDIVQPLIAVIMRTLNNGKAHIIQHGEALHIKIPSHKSWILLIFGTLWLGGWLFGLINAFELFGLHGGWSESINNIFLIFWILLWSLGGFLVLGLLLWGYFGQEELYIARTGRNAYLRKHIFGLGRKKKLEKDQMKNFRFHEVKRDIISAKRVYNVWGLGRGKVKFDYGHHTYTFGLALDDSEAHYLIYLLEEEKA